MYLIFHKFTNPKGKIYFEEHTSFRMYAHPSRRFRFRSFILSALPFIFSLQFADCFFYHSLTLKESLMSSSIYFTRNKKAKSESFRIFPGRKNSDKIDSPSSNVHKNVQTRSQIMLHSSLSSTDSFLFELSNIIAKANEKEITLKHSSNGFGGGGGASIIILENEKDSSEKYFVKKTGLHGFDMLFAEYKGTKEIYDTHTIKTPKPIGVSSSDSSAFVIFEHLNLGGSKNDESCQLMGTQLAKMHKCRSSNGKYGWDINNTCGATAQINTWTDKWSEFFVNCRLRHILKLCHRDGTSFYNEEDVLRKIKHVLEEHETSHSVEPSLVHGG